MSQSKGRFGVHGGQYIPETLMNAVIELENAYEHYKNDPDYFYVCINGSYHYCIPYNEHTAHLLGTTDPYTKGGSK